MIVSYMKHPCRFLAVLLHRFSEQTSLRNPMYYDYYKITHRSGSQKRVLLSMLLNSLQRYKKYLIYARKLPKWQRKNGNF